ncbi:TPA: hypothetical protein PTV43_000162 [Clostridium botulinum]|nr:hypothetical protein [Clostridium botulinum]HDK7155072.1 hypothetical protein [Clostridium botulinum]
MENKKVNLKTWIWIKIIPTILIFIYYHIRVKSNFTFLANIWLKYIIVACILISSVFVAKKREVIDEFAQENLYITDSICFKIAFCILGIIMLPMLFTLTSSIVIGYMVTGSLVFLTVFRAIIFCVIDQKGM